ncbi:RNA polymerase subunit sigma [Streptomyces sp. CB02923]|uniref:SigB/SigF/SigG family RNA polymerase sigma factor n=1 Tax=Streptomyces sp. CB02923 TaxID=1718985 RepID=UPI00093BD43A|nr:SigB/SigF/SigG family RNA polymerase sigma factor [Streptomyces sp. CB02923]OKI02672.1 RNA polymerase subunit sigma [Streptomyces sp. CB02923]
MLAVQNSAAGPEAAAAAEAVQAPELPRLQDATKVAPRDARALSKLFLARLAALEEGTAEYQYARNTLIEMNLSLVRFAASRFRGRGQDLGHSEDIIQVGTIGLIKAIDRFDLSREVEFSTFAVPYIVGEIKRFFRDSTWAVHVPRRVQELRVELSRAGEQLSADLGREPTARELAAHLKIGEDEVVDAIAASNGYTAGPLDSPGDGSGAAGDSRAIADVMGDDDPAMELVENLNTLAPLLHELDERRRRIIEMRFVQEMTQAQIGAELGISQMHVSRLLTRTLAQLRKGMLDQ